MSHFLRTAGWADAQTEPLAGDASSRRYTRLRRGAQSAILMEDPTGDTALFARLARHLLAVGLSAPRILAEAPGLLLLEDLGDALIARLPQQEPALYLLATDALISLHGAPPPDVPQATPEHLTQIVDLAFTEYAHLPEAQDAAQSALRPLLEQHATPADVMILRDYHAENILYLPERNGAARAGLLDFQDAMIGHRAYDLASLLRDARRDVSEATAAACIRHYLDHTGSDPEAFAASFAALSVQRNLRILGVFARLARLGKPRYLDLMPRVWAHLQTDLAHPALAPLRAPLQALPPPDAAHLRRLRP